MAGGKSRPRSNTSASTISAKPRSTSRASTASLNPPTEQSAPGFQHVFPSNSSHLVQSAQPSTDAYTLEDMIERSKQQLINAESSFPVDPSLQRQRSQSRAMSVEISYAAAQAISRPLTHTFTSYDGKENYVYPTVGENKTQIGAAMLEGQRKSKGNAASQANDQELRRLYLENSHRDLKDVATSVLANDRGPKSEKTKQIFAMIWLSSVCRKSSTSVPRNRVYAQYAERCGTERVPLLNPASFGKLVRIIFPDITTRRLGMRGESKYHYVDLALIDDDPEASPFGNGDADQVNREEIETITPTPLLVPFPTAIERNNFPADTAEFPSPTTASDNQPSRPTTHLKIEARGHLFLDRGLMSIHRGPSRPNMISRRLKFATMGAEESPPDAPIEFPELQPYLPPGTDCDAAAALKALYRSHCISVIDCVRFCKEKSFWHHFTSLHGTLTVPVQKLFAHPSIAPWIRECDWLMYQKMIQFVSPLALQVMPEVVTAAFQSISDNLGRQIQIIFQNHPQHVRDAKHGPAVIFSGLLGRLLRVNAASHAAAHILGNDATRDQMWYDWVHHVKPTVTAETCLPGVGYSRCIQILTNEVRDLLSPLGTVLYPGMQQIYATTGRDSNGKASQFSDLDDSSTSSVLDRWVTFLHGLPSRFPNADARTLLHCVSDVGTAALRDITMATAVSFGQWTVTKVWVDEMMQWLAEKGGFMENPPGSTEIRPQKRTANEADFVNDGRPDSKRRISATATGNAPKQSQSNPYPPSGNLQCETTSGPGIAQNATIHTSHKHPAYGNYSQASPIHYGYGAENSVFCADASPHLPELSRPTNEQHVSLRGSEARQAQQFPEQQREQLMHCRPTPLAAKVLNNDELNDDSGLGPDLELPQQQTTIRVADYGGFVASNTNSDPADVVVC